MKNKNLAIFTVISALSLLAAGCGSDYYYSYVGKDGKNGVDGSSCTVTEVSSSPAVPNGGAIITCADSSVLVKNGANGQDGVSSIVSLIDPCGDAPGIYDEVILRLNDGTLLASFSDNANGKNTRLSVIGEGSYQVTDGSGCAFSITSDGSVTF